MNQELELNLSCDCERQDYYGCCETQDNIKFMGQEGALGPQARLSQCRGKILLVDNNNLPLWHSS